MNLLVVTQFLSFQFAVAQTNCEYSIKFWETNNVTSATAGQTLHFQAEVTRKANDINSCSNSVNIQALLSTQSGSTPVSGGGSANFAVTQSGSTATQNFSYTVPPGQTTGSLQFQASAYTSAITRVAQSSVLTISISGSTGTTGSVKMNVYFKPAQGSYNIGDSLQILIQANKNDVDNLPSNVQSIFIQPAVNNQNIPGFTVARNDLANYSQYKDTSVSTQNNFKTGVNSISVTLWQAGTSLKLGTGNAVIQVNSSTGQPTVISDKTKVSIGDTVSFTVQNVSTGWSGTYSVNNGQEIEFSSLNLSLPATTANGFKDNADNTVTFTLLNQDGTPVDLKNEGVVTINVNPNNKNQTPGGTTPGNTTSSNNDKLINPLPTDNLLATFLNIAKGFLAGIAIWAVIFIIVGGFRMVVAAGNEEAITVAKKTITWAILGLVIALLSFSIVAIVQNLLNVNVKDLNPGTINPSSYIQTKNIKT